MNSGYTLLETEQGLYYDVSYEPIHGIDIIVIDTDDNSQVNLTKQDLVDMLEALE